ncbi:MAG: PEP-CTERM sorting domain-containing protein [Kiritimatiellia bacterium]|nr:PEP-CTERM sorting domain-containing protein [Kiritimatiellia bacterium]
MKTNKMRKMVLFGFVATWILGVATMGWAQNTTWNQTGSGTWNWNDPANWSAGTPTTATNALFASSATNTVQLSANSGVLRIRESGTPTLDLTLDLNGYTLTAAGNPGLTIGLDTASAVNFTLMSSQSGGLLDAVRIRSGNMAASDYINMTLTGSNLFVNQSGSSGTYLNERANGKLVVRDGAGLNTYGELFFASGDNKSQFAEFWITGPGSVVTTRSNARLGLQSTNLPLLVVTNGAMYSVWGANTLAQGGDAPASYSPGANALFLVTGTGSHATNTTLTVSEMAGNGVLTKSGYTGTGGGFVLVEKGGILNVGALNIGRGARVSNGLTNELAYGQVIVRDTGSIFRASASQQIGQASQGAVYVLNGGTFMGSTSAHTILGNPRSVDNYTNVNAYGLLVISNAGSYAEVRSLRVGGDTALSYGYGDVMVLDGASLKTTHADGITLRPRSGLTVSDSFVESSTLILETNTTVRIELGARSHSEYYINLTGALNIAANVNLEIGVLDSFNALPGEDIWLIDFASRTGVGEFVNLKHGNTFIVGDYEFEFIVGDAFTDMYLNVVQVIPEPGTLGLIGVGLGLAAILRRRRQR